MAEKIEVNNETGKEKWDFDSSQGNCLPFTAETMLGFLGSSGPKLSCLPSNVIEAQLEAGKFFEICALTNCRKRSLLTTFQEAVEKGGLRRLVRRSRVLRRIILRLTLSKDRRLGGLWLSLRLCSKQRSARRSLRSRGVAKGAWRIVRGEEA